MRKSASTVNPICWSIQETQKLRRWYDPGNQVSVLGSLWRCVNEHAPVCGKKSVKTESLPVFALHSERQWRRDWCCADPTHNLTQTQTRVILQGTSHRGVVPLEFTQQLIDAVREFYLLHRFGYSCFFLVALVVSPKRQRRISSFSSQKHSSHW